MFSMLLGRIISSKLEDPKAPVPIEVMPSGSSKTVSPIPPPKAQSPIVLSVLGKVIVVRFKQLLNALSSIPEPCPS